MKKVTIIIPNYNGLQYLEKCLHSLEVQTEKEFRTLLIDNGSTDESVPFVQKNFPWVECIRLEYNTGFCGAVNCGIRHSETPYILLLNNDTEAAPDFVAKMLEGIKRHKKAFSCSAKMLQYRERDKIDDAGNYYNALGWAFARGKGKDAENYQKEEKIFSSCGGAAIYRTEILEKIGIFDEEHFAYLEDTDIGYRSKIYGYENWFLPEAIVYHVGSGTSGSRYNQFKIRYSSRNNVYMVYKNMPFLQLVLNFPFLVLGFGIKLVYFSTKGYGKEYAAGIKNGISLCKKQKKVKITSKEIINLCKIQFALWGNIVRRFL